MSSIKSLLGREHIRKIDLFDIDKQSRLNKCNCVDIRSTQQVIDRQGKNVVGDFY